MPDTTSSEMHKAMFMQLVVMLSSSAMHHLGKIINPATGKTELNLEAAQATIDMVEMIDVTAHSSGTGAIFPRQSEDPPNRSIHSLIVLPGKLCLPPSLRCERLHD